MQWLCHLDSMKLDLKDRANNHFTAMSTHPDTVRLSPQVMDLQFLTANLVRQLLLLVCQLVTLTIQPPVHCNNMHLLTILSSAMTILGPPAAAEVYRDSCHARLVIRRCL